MRKFRFLAWRAPVAAALGLWISACGSPPPAKVEVKMDDATKQALQTLKGARVFFAHHSVGNNLLDGVRALQPEAGVQLNFQKPGAIPAEGGVFADAEPGHNTKPETKVDGFKKALLEKQDGGADLAMMKFCYIDFSPDTDPKQIFDDYVKMVDEVKAARPELTFVHMTTPLESRPEGFMDSLRRMLGRGVWQDESNVKRGEFNKLLLERFKGEPIFDLAKVESTAPDGAREMHKDGGEAYYSMLAAYTSDGGHLNEAGKKLGAQAMLKALAAAYQSRAPVAEAAAPEAPKAD